ncbi:zinc finger white collar 2 protein WC-2 [Lasiosphaeria miniovina]|uniref:Zinc finger white collar 2 protein WC-2 n=1 Tax=Lasiosphaeria miniovina TaxID=1954250 RepID=A0AA40BIG2_9PEZI|nr:zinc finger white collar 2 protein WC-2 [Lasiosphaeria miniovina]KAK0734821.1 zinc finger white collar 2 protein WC-2 [Lasiosphaeria miniovina]
MSHGPGSQQRQHVASLFGFGAMGAAGSDLPQSCMQMTGDPNDMMSLLDGSMFPHFDPMSMNLDVSDMASQSYAPPEPPASTSAHRLAAGGRGEPPFSPDDTVSGSGSLHAANLAPAGAASGPGVNTLTEFTKRRNWPARVVEELQDFLQILDPNGRIKHVSPSVERLTGWKAAEIHDRFLNELIHPDDVGVFTAELNESIASGSPLRLFYRLRKKDDSYAIFETVGHAHIAAAKFAPNPNNQSPFCQAVFMMGRPYPTKNAGLLDSFLEHKIENERLKRRIAELRKEEADDVDESQRTWRQSQEGRSDLTPSEDASHTVATPFHHAASPDTTMLPPERPTSLNVALTRENLEGIAGGRPDSIREKMARYEGASHVETIERLTGLRYQEGERSRGITTGNTSPTLIRGDAGIAIPMDRDPRTGEKKKKLKVAEEYVCTDCGTLESPEWRKGPSGPKTLCNACGLRWAKKEKRKGSSSNALDTLS